MKKITLSFVSILLLIFLVSCSKNSEKSVELSIVNQSLVSNNYTYVFNITGEFNQTQIEEIAYDATNNVYTLLSEKIGNNLFYLTITIQVNSTSKIQLKYIINSNFEHPGLTLLSKIFY